MHGRRMPMYVLWLVITTLIGFSAPTTGQSAQNQPAPPPIKWVQGPYTAKLGEYAEIDVPKDFLFANGDGARKYLELTGNPASNQEVGVIAPKSEQESWFVIFEFDEVGFVKDDDRSSLDPSALLKSIQQATEDANEIRKKNGWTPFHITGWYKPPFYDVNSLNLTWATDGVEEKRDSKTVNYSVRVLGRRGTMNVDLILGPEEVEKTVPVFNSMMRSCHFVEGNRYADFTQGDKLAGYGLTALIAGGAGAVAAKTGLLAKFWKLIVALFAAMWKIIVVAFAAIVSRFKMIWAWMKSKTSRGEKKPEDDEARAPSNPQPNQPPSLLATLTETTPPEDIHSSHVGD